MLATLSDGRRAVIKGSSTIVQEAFALRLAERLGVPVPAHRVLQYAEPEWANLKHHVLQGVARRQGLPPSAYGALDRAFLRCMSLWPRVLTCLLLPHVPAIFSALRASAGRPRWCS